MGTADIKPPSTKHVILSVHGTYAADEKDEGPAWWQLGSTTCNEIQRALPDSFEWGYEGKVFHWSGRNSEQSRQVAAAALLDEWLKSLEKSRRRYHLIGHSHGGSVIWNALCLATERGVPLDGLDSWASVGTPFIKYKAPWWRVAIHILGQCVLSLLIGFTFAVFGFAILTMVIEAARLLWAGDWQLFDLWTGDWQLFDAVREPLFPLDVYLWIVAGFATVFAIVSTWDLLATYRTHSRLDAETFSHYGSRWLGLWSSEDEAIITLKTAAQLKKRILPRYSDRDDEVSLARQAVTQRPLFMTRTANDETNILPLWLIRLDISNFFGLLYNVLASLWLDRALRQRTRDSLCGNTTLGYHVFDVSPTPISDPLNKVPAIPPEIDDQLIESADEEAKANGIISTVRRSLARSALGGEPTEGLTTLLGDVFSGHELIHCSYFNQPAVLYLLFIHIETQANLAASGASRESRSLANWYTEFRRAIQDEMRQAK